MDEETQAPGCNLPLGCGLLLVPICAFGLMPAGSDQDLLNSGGLALKCLLAAAALAAVAWRAVCRNSLGFIFAAPFCVTTFMALNALATAWNSSEPGEPFFLDTRVVEKRFIRSQKGNSRNVLVSPGLDADPDVWFAPNEATFSQLQEGGSVRMTLRRGRLGYCWVERVEVLAAPPAPPRRRGAPEPTPRG